MASTDELEPHLESSLMFWRLLTDGGGLPLLGGVLVMVNAESMVDLTMIVAKLENEDGGDFGAGRVRSITAVVTVGMGVVITTVLLQLRRCAVWPGGLSIS